MSYFLISAFFVSIGTLQAQSRPNVIAVSFVVGAWCVGVPLSYVFSHPLHMVSRRMGLLHLTAVSNDSVPVRAAALLDMIV